MNLDLNGVCISAILDLLVDALGFTLPMQT